jgi:hypothetical protein
MISNGELTASNITSTRAYLDTHWTDYSVQGQIRFPSRGARGGLGGRLDSTSGARYAAWINREDVDSNSASLRLMKFQSWSDSDPSVLAETIVPDIGTNSHLLKLSFVSNEIVVSLDDTNRFNVTDPEIGGMFVLASGGVSAESESSNSSMIAIDNVSVLLNKPRLVVTADAVVRCYGTENPVLTGQVFGLRSGDNILVSYLTTADAGSPVGDYAILPTINDPNAMLDGYELTINAGTLTVTQALLIVTPDNQFWNYGQAPGPLTGKMVGIQNGDDISASYSTPGGALSSVGTYPIFSSLSDPDQKLSNYLAVANNGILTILQSILLITPLDQSRAFGAANPALSGTVSPLLNGDNIAANFWTPADINSPVGSYPILGSLLDPNGRVGNYYLIYVTGTLAITPASLSASLVSSVSPALQGSNVTFTATLTAPPTILSPPSGSIRFSVDGALLGAPVPVMGGTAEMSTTSLSAGPHNVTADYVSDGNFSANTASVVQMVSETALRPGRLAIHRNSDGTMTIGFSGTPGSKYLVLSAGELGATNWSVLATNMPDENGLATFTDLDASYQARRFYRIARP